MRPLEEARALTAIAEALAARNFQAEIEQPVKLSTGQELVADLRVQGERIAIEYLSSADMAQLESIPAPAPGSRLHVVIAQTVPKDDPSSKENLYLFFINENNFVYQYNPTSDNRSNVTFMEVNSRLKRDVNDFLTWYEKQTRQQ